MNPEDAHELSILAYGTTARERIVDLIHEHGLHASPLDCDIVDGRVICGETDLGGIDESDA